MSIEKIRELLEIIFFKYRDIEKHLYYSQVAGKPDEREEALKIEIQTLKAIEACLVELLEIKENEEGGIENE